MKTLTMQELDAKYFPAWDIFVYRLDEKNIALLHSYSLVARETIEDFNIEIVPVKSVLNEVRLYDHDKLIAVGEKGSYLIYYKEKKTMSIMPEWLFELSVLNH